jgi:hypothetical protein
MHAARIVGWTLLSIWAYLFCGAHVMRTEVGEQQGMNRRANQFVLMLFWPIFHILDPLLRS